VRRVIEIAALYPDRTERQAEFPELDDEDVAQALHYAALQLPDGISPSKPSVIRIREEGLKGSQIAEPLITANQTLIGKMLLKTISHKRC